MSMIVDDFLEHFGVKGQKWGIRKARKELDKFGDNARKINSESIRAKSPAERKAAAKKYEKEVLNEMKTPEFKAAWKAANTMGKGEKAAHILLFGPFAMLTISSVKKTHKENATQGYEDALDTSIMMLKEMRAP